MRVACGSMLRAAAALVGLVHVDRAERVRHRDTLGSFPEGAPRSEDQVLVAQHRALVRNKTVHRESEDEEQHENALILLRQTGHTCRNAQVCSPHPTHVQHVHVTTVTWSTPRKPHGARSSKTL